MSRTIAEKEANMEIVTTVENFPKEAQKLDLEPHAQIRVIVEDSQEKTASTAKKSTRRFKFLDDPVWEGDENSPTDISVNVDHYLYDLEDPHGR